MKYPLSAPGEREASWLSLFASTATLICCALPIVLVTIGLGATVASVTAAVPALIVVSKYKLVVFAGSGALLAVTSWAIYRPGRHCPTDPVTGRLCDRSMIWNRRIFWLAGGIWTAGFFAAYLALPVRIALEGLVSMP